MLIYFNKEVTSQKQFLLSENSREIKVSTAAFMYTMHLIGKLITHKKPVINEFTLTYLVDGPLYTYIN